MQQDYYYQDYSDAGEEEKTLPNQDNSSNNNNNNNNSNQMTTTFPSTDIQQDLSLEEKDPKEIKRIHMEQNGKVPLEEEEEEKNDDDEAGKSVSHVRTDVPVHTDVLMIFWRAGEVHVRSTYEYTST